MDFPVSLRTNEFSEGLSFSNFVGSDTVTEVNTLAVRWRPANSLATARHIFLSLFCYTSDKGVSAYHNIMPKKSSPRKPAKHSPKRELNWRETQLSQLRSMRDGLRDRQRLFLGRRPHRSFQLTRRRDYVRGTGLPGYIAMTYHVFATLKKNARLFGLAVLVFSLLSIALTGVASQQTYSQAQEIIAQSGKDIFSGAAGKMGEAALLIVGGFTGSSANMSPEQQIYLTLSLFLTWLVTVWLLRELFAGRKPRFRDGLYNSGAPIVPTMLIVLWIAVQMIPIGIISIVYAALSGVGIIGDGFGAMLFAIITTLVGTLVLYWTVPSFLALVIVTLPGMYPVAALRAAGDLVVGKRLAVLYRMLWLIGTILLAWGVVMVPLVILDGWLKSMWQWYAQFPMVPLLVATASTMTIVWSSTYIYIMYRKMVDHGAK